MDTPKIVAIILNYVNWKDTIDCIHSLQECTYPNLEIIIIDNHSPNDSFQRLQLQFPNIPTHQTGANLGYTGGINYGFKICESLQSNYILVINNDTIVQNDFLSELISEHEKYKDVFISCPLILAEHDRNVIWYAGGKLQPLLGKAVHFQKGEQKKFLKRVTPCNVTFVTGCCYLIRKEMLTDIGYLNENYFMYLDDIEYSARIIKKGFNLRFVPSAVIYHKVEGEKESAFKLFYSVRNRLLLIENISQGLTKFIASTYFIAAITIKMFIWKFVNPVFYKTAKVGIQAYYRKEFFKRLDP
jgi:GT2 family glycosyltransferase